MILLSEAKEEAHRRAMAGVHDSTTCTLGSDGGPCDWCREIGESEREVQGMDELMESVVEQVREEVVEEQPRYASVGTIRAAIFDVIDAGDQDQQPWAFYEHDHGGLKGYTWSEEMANRDRCLFADAVIARIAQLQSPPHKMDVGLQALIARARKVLRRGGKR